MKVDKRRMELQKWKNGIGDRTESKLRKTLSYIGSVVDVKLFNIALGEYNMLPTNSRSLVMNLRRRTCSCKWWQLKALSSAQAMEVIGKKKLWVYDCVSDYYKTGTQNTCTSATYIQ